MYGLILENLSQYIISVYGEEKWLEIRRMARVDQHTFSTHLVYPDSLIPKLTSKACKVLGVSEKEFLECMGVYFVSFVSQYGYDRVLGVLGRHMRDFINGLDNLHEYLKFSYPRMKAPSFFCENETATGLILHYRSTRRGFLWYSIGQIREVGRHFYQTEVEIEILKEETVFDTLHVMMQLTFDNRAFQIDMKHQTHTIDKSMLPINALLFLEIFPFCIVFDQALTIRSIGNSLQAIMPEIMNRKLMEAFDLTKPMIECTWRAIQTHINNIFELISVDPIKKVDLRNRTPVEPPPDDDANREERLLYLKGQMMYMEEWKSMAYLGTPIMRDLEAMVTTGIFINDLSMHDFSRDMVLAGQQQSAEMKLALDQELQKSKQLEESMRKLDKEMKRTDELLYQMIPKQVADRLRKGEASVETCQMFESVTILFSDVVSFTEICSRITPMQVVSMLNSMYSLFDQLTEKHNVYKVETIGDAYMVVCGAPEAEEQHAVKVCQMALDMVEVIGDLKDPSTDTSLKIRVGVHSGAVVAGVVGLKMPRYCLFGDAVNTASRMESTSEALKIHISQLTKDRLNENEWRISERGTVSIKGKGEMKTYWLHERLAPPLLVLSEVQSRAEDDLSPPDRRSLEEEILELDLGDTRSLYSPVTFEDVTKYSPVSSPSSSIRSDIFQKRKSSPDDKPKTIRPPSSKLTNIIQKSEGPTSSRPTNNIQISERPPTSRPTNNIQKFERPPPPPTTTSWATAPVNVVAPSPVKDENPRRSQSSWFKKASLVSVAIQTSMNEKDVVPPPTVNTWTAQEVTPTILLPNSSSHNNGFMHNHHAQRCWCQCASIANSRIHRHHHSHHLFQKVATTPFITHGPRRGGISVIQVAPRLKDSSVSLNDDTENTHAIIKSNTCAIL